MGRRAIPIERIDQLRKRHTTFNKRKIGLLKKAIELSILCDVDISITMFSKNNGDLKMHRYSSAEEHDIDTQIMSFKGNIERFTNASFPHALPSRKHVQESDVAPKHLNVPQHLQHSHHNQSSLLPFSEQINCNNPSLLPHSLYDIEQPQCLPSYSQPLIFSYDRIESKSRKDDDSKNTNISGESENSQDTIIQRYPISFALPIWDSCRQTTGDKDGKEVVGVQNCHQLLANNVLPVAIGQRQAFEGSQNYENTMLNEKLWKKNLSVQIPNQQFQTLAIPTGVTKTTEQWAEQQQFYAALSQPTVGGFVDDHFKNQMPSCLNVWSPSTSSMKQNYKWFYSSIVTFWKAFLNWPTYNAIARTSSIFIAFFFFFWKCIFSLNLFSWLKIVRFVSQLMHRWYPFNFLRNAHLESMTQLQWIATSIEPKFVLWWAQGSRKGIATKDNWHILMVQIKGWCQWHTSKSVLSKRISGGSPLTRLDRTDMSIMRRYECFVMRTKTCSISGKI